MNQEQKQEILDNLNAAERAHWKLQQQLDASRSETQHARARIKDAMEEQSGDESGDDAGEVFRKAMRLQDSEKLAELICINWGPEQARALIKAIRETLRVPVAGNNPPAYLPDAKRVIGERIAEAFELTWARDENHGPFDPPRWETEYGSKTGVGIFEMVRGISDKIEDGQSDYI